MKTLHSLLHLFLEESGESHAADAGQPFGRTDTPDGVPSHSGHDAGGRDMDAEFETLIKGEFKDAFSKRTEKIVKARVKDASLLRETLSAQQPIMAMLQKRYGQSNTAALLAAMQNDAALSASILHTDASGTGASGTDTSETGARGTDTSETGTPGTGTPETGVSGMGTSGMGASKTGASDKDVSGMDAPADDAGNGRGPNGMHQAEDLPDADEAKRAAPDEDARRQEALTRRRQVLAHFLSEERRIKEQYPNFALASELRNPQFASMLANGVPMRTAFLSAHIDEFLNGAIAYTAKKVAALTAENIRKNGTRPPEGGGFLAVNTAPDYKNMSADEITSLLNKAIRG